MKSAVGGPIDPAAHLRGDLGYQQASLSDPATRFMALAEGRPVIDSDEARTYCRLRWLEPSAARELRVNTGDAIFLGRSGAEGPARYALIFDEAHPAVTSGLLSPAVDYRSLITQGTMSADDMAAVAVARSLSHWHEHARFCGKCGARTQAVESGWKRLCSGCLAQFFPRVDPVVIMLVSDGERALLAREPHFPPGMYSALAGFVEPGESLEQAVVRETREEVGLEVSQVRMIANQPWPMPHSLMIGFLASARPGDLLYLSGSEIEAARWCCADELAQMLEGRHPERLWLPPRQAIANRLIRAWLQREPGA